MDGLRGLFFPDPELGLVSRTFKKSFNPRVSEHFQDLWAYAREHAIVLDGELYSTTLSHSEQSGLLRACKTQPDIPESLHFHLFDCIPIRDWLQETEKPYQQRVERLEELRGIPGAQIVPQRPCESVDAVLSLFEADLKAGFEGSILRCPAGRYKHNRCTLRERNLFKLKEYVTEKGVVVGVHAQERAEPGERTADAFGYSQAGQRVADRLVIDALGSLVVSVQRNGQAITVRIGSGFDFRGGDKDRTRLWQIRSQLIGKVCEFKHQLHGAKKRPRQPVFLRWRSNLDWSLTNPE